MREVLLATGNPGKAREMREILAGADDRRIQWRYLNEFAATGWPEPVEDGATFLANAEIKARHYARLSGLWTIADDSGLAVDALGGEPGVRSARYAGEPKNDAANNALLIRNLVGIPRDQRTARFCCAVVLAGTTSRGLPCPSKLRERRREPARPTECIAAIHPDPVVLASAEGTVEGLIIDEPRGKNGFGYDPHFWVPTYSMTAAEMPPAVKHAISHRGQALRRLREQLTTILESPRG